jgi:hypothetical protein
MVRTQGDDDYDRKLLEDVQRFGWHLVGIKDDPEGPAYVFSVGMYHTHGQPEICIFGLRDTGVMAQIVNEIGDLLRSGETFQDWEGSEDVLDNYPCIFRKVDPSRYPVLLVTHDDDGDWQFLCNTTNDTEDARVVCLQYFVENHPSVTELADLLMGWQAMRVSPDQPWKRARKSE